MNANIITAFDQLGLKQPLLDVLDEIGYEIGDVLRDYVDSITHSYGLDSDSIDYNVVMEEEFNIERRKVD